MAFAPHQPWITSLVFPSHTGITPALPRLLVHPPERAIPRTHTPGLGNGSRRSHEMSGRVHTRYSAVAACEPSLLPLDCTKDPCRSKFTGCVEPLNAAQPHQTGRESSGGAEREEPDAPGCTSESCPRPRQRSRTGALDREPLARDTIKVGARVFKLGLDKGHYVPSSSSTPVAFRSAAISSAVPSNSSRTSARASVMAFNLMWTASSKR